MGQEVVRLTGKVALIVIVTNKKSISNGPITLLKNPFILLN